MRARVPRAALKGATMRTVALLPFLLVVALCGCSTVRPAKRYGNTQLESLKTAYIMWAPGLDRTIESYAKEALETHGVKVSSGSRQEKPADVDFYVECETLWWL